MPPLPPPSTEKKDEKEKKEDTPKVWNDSEVQLLKKWGETAASYRLLHDRAYRIYSWKSYMYAVPVIVFSTITGTASFSQTLFPPAYQPYVPMVIGGVNICIGVLGTLARFFRVDELTEAHRVASVSYGKFSRNIATELSLPPQNRKYNGADLVEMCRTEMDRLIEQSPVIPMKILLDFKKNKDFANITKPEVLDIKPIEEYKMSKEEKVANIVTNVVEKLRQAKPEKTLVQQMAEKHGAPAPASARPLSMVPSQPPVHTLGITTLLAPEVRKDAPKVSDLSSINTNALREGTNKVVDHRKKELEQIANHNVVSNAKSHFQGLLKKRLSKEELKSATQTILTNAIEAGESAIADVEMGITQAQKEVEAEIKSDGKENPTEEHE